jgi:hypothetical protein
LKESLDVEGFCFKTETWGRKFFPILIELLEGDPGVSGGKGLTRATQMLKFFTEEAG